jgi:hypothetical protein
MLWRGGARDLFRREGFDKVTIEDLASAAGIGRSTRHALAPLIQAYREDPGNALALSRLVRNTSSLRAWRLEKLQRWSRTLSHVLAERSGAPHAASLTAAVRAAAALDCFDTAVDHWTASDGALNLVDLLDEAFAALQPIHQGATRRRLRSDGRRTLSVAMEKSPDVASKSPHLAGGVLISR